uniref:Uncharacterized protein n=1 Tax=Strigamia maritima TaxID=126957 RepID=T1IM93_STRMM
MVAIGGAEETLLKILPKSYHVLALFVGGLPDKLTSFIGKEIEYDVSMSVEEIMERLAEGMQSHIDECQIVPGSVLRALRERFSYGKIITSTIV